MSSRVGFSDCVSEARAKGAELGSFRRNRGGHRKPFRLGSQANTGSLSLVPCGWSAIGIVSVLFRTAYLPFSSQQYGRPVRSVVGRTPRSARVPLDPLCFS